MNRVSTKVIKARQVEVHFVIDERNHDDVMNMDRLRKEGVRDFNGQMLDLKLTDFLTVHNVIAIEDIQFVSASKQPSYLNQAYLDGSSNPRTALVKVKLIIDNARAVKSLDENLLTLDAEVSQLGQSHTKAIR